MPFSRKPFATSAWPLTAVVAICVKEVLQIKDREDQRGQKIEEAWKKAAGNTQMFLVWVKEKEKERWGTRKGKSGVANR